MELFISVNVCIEQVMDSIYDKANIDCVEDKIDLAEEKDVLVEYISSAVNDNYDFGFEDLNQDSQDKLIQECISYLRLDIVNDLGILHDRFKKLA